MLHKLSNAISKRRACEAKQNSLRRLLLISKIQQLQIFIGALDCLLRVSIDIARAVQVA